MAKSAVLGTISIGTCEHSPEGNQRGRVVIASEDVVTGSQKRGVARIGDKVVCNQGCVGYIDTSSSSVKINGKGRATIGSHFSGDYEGYLIENPSEITVDVKI